jgi:hypothetical protein
VSAGEGGGEGGGEEGGNVCVRADRFLLRPRTVKPIRGVNADAGERPDSNFHPKTSIITSLPQA